MQNHRQTTISTRVAPALAWMVLFAPLLHLNAESADAGVAMRLLKKNCLSCHNEEKKKGGLLMTTREALIAGGESGEALVAGSPDQSPLIASLAADADPHMPPKKQLSPKQIEVLRKWVTNGAPWDAEALAKTSEGLREVKLAAVPSSYHPVLTLALSPDSTRLAVGCGSEVVIYEKADADLSLKIRGRAHPDPVQSIAWSPDGTLVATGAFRRVVVWNAETLAVERVITAGLTDRIAALQFLPDGKRLVIADGLISEEGTVRIIELGSGAIAKAWQAHADMIFDLAVSKDGKLLATAGGDNLVKIWDLETQKEIGRLEGHTTQVLALEFNADATQLVTGGADQHVKLWDIKAKEQIGILGKLDAAVSGVAWAPADSTILAVTDNGVLMRYTDLQARPNAQSFQVGNGKNLEAANSILYCLTASANGERIFAGSYDGRVVVWNKDGKLLNKLEVTENKITASLAK
jgi:WD40 repeat protein/mono/diheme cytochrome c family protein